MVREINEDELLKLLELYLDLHETSVPHMSSELVDTWRQIMNDNNHHIIVNEVGGEIVSSCVLVVIPNLTRGIRPYALIENVVTKKNFRRNGYATECLNYAKELAVKDNCYKIMLLTGANDKETLDFYKKAGFNSGDKTAFIMWLNN